MLGTGNKYIPTIKKLFRFLDLDHQPLADDLSPIKQGHREVLYYPLSISFCKKCILLQNDYIVGDNKLYPKSYHYVPGITKDVLKNFESLSKSLIYNYKINKDKDLIVDLGCNDGRFSRIAIRNNMNGIHPYPIAFQP